MKPQKCDLNANPNIQIKHHQTFENHTPCTSQNNVGATQHNIQVYENVHTKYK